MRFGFVALMIAAATLGQEPVSRPTLVGEPPIFRPAPPPESRDSDIEAPPTDLSNPAVEAENMRKEREFQKRIREATPTPKSHMAAGSLLVICSAALLLLLVVGGWLLGRRRD